MLITIICVLVYLCIAFLIYTKEIKHWNHPTWEKIYFSLFWILLVPLFGIHWLNKNL